MLALLAWPVLAGQASAQAPVPSPPSAAGGESILGSSTASEAALTGILYDLKQDEHRNPAINNTHDYDSVIASFLTKGWDESVFDPFYRVSHPFYTTQIFIPMLASKAAPKAFGVENRIQDGYWVIHYKAQVVPPADGRYRFAGYAHATIFVAINHRLVLNGSRWDVSKAARNLPGLAREAGAPAGDFHLCLGDWVDLKHSQPVDIDILVGNRQATVLCAFLLVQKADEIYPIDPATKFPILPVFQLTPYTGLPFPEGKLSTRAQFNTSIWKCLQ